MSQAFITSIEGNRQLLDGGAMFGNAPRPVWEKWIAPDQIGRIPLACRGLLIEFDGRKLLCETGIGAFFDPKLASRYGVQTPERHRLLENLRAAGHTPESIDYVILSHLHFDHAGGLLPTFHEMQNGHHGLVFPNAHFIVGEEAWERALHPHPRDRASFIPGLTDKLQATGRLIVHPRDPLPAALAAHLEFLTTSGHTPGQMHTLFKGARQKVFFCGDLIPGRAWVHLPITMGYDRFPEQVIDEKEAVYRRAVGEDWLLFYTHDPEVSGSHVSRNENGKFEPTQSEAAYSHFAI
jgi:glyoxylase-like metal-dependent hydrolase (beta-lactamase superfamily II)